jgi:hypothetical protein
MTETTRPAVAKRLFRPIEPTTTYFTFGTMYRDEERHPSGLPAVGNGWWEVEGVSHEQARAMVHALTDGNFAFAYTEENFRPEFYPLGCTYRITAGEPFATEAYVAERRAAIEAR